MLFIKASLDHKLGEMLRKMRSHHLRIWKRSEDSVSNVNINRIHTRRHAVDEHLAFSRSWEREIFHVLENLGSSVLLDDNRVALRHFAST